MTVSYDPISRNVSEMGATVKIEPASVAALDSSIDGDFYMATIRGGKVEKVINMRGGPLLRVRRVLDFNSKVERQKEQALTLKRKQLGSGIEPEVRKVKKEKTLAEIVLEMKRRKSEGALASVKREVIAVKEVIHVTEVIDMKEVIPVTEEVPEEISPSSKKRKRRSVSELHACPKPVLPSEHLAVQRDDETLGEWLTRSAGATGRASSDNNGIKVFQRRKVKLKAIRKRTSEPVSDVSNAIDIPPPVPPSPFSRTRSRGRVPVSTPTTSEDNEISQLTSTVVGNPVEDVGSSLLNDVTMEEFSTKATEQFSHPDRSVVEIDRLTLYECSSQLPGLPSTQDPDIDSNVDMDELTLEQLRGEAAYEQGPSNTEVVTLQNADDAGSELRDSDMAEALNAETKKQPTSYEASGVEENVAQESCAFNTETSGVEEDEGQESCAFNMETSLCSNTSPLDLEPILGKSYLPALPAGSVDTTVELELVEERISALLETLVPPDDLLPNHLSASLNSTTRKKKKRKRLSKSVMTRKYGRICMGSLDVNNVTMSTEPICLDTTSENDSSSVAVSEEDNLPGTLGPQSSNQDPTISEEHGLPHGPTTTLNSEGKDMIAEVVLPSLQVEILPDKEEFCSIGGHILNAVESPELPAKSFRNRDSEICQTSFANVDGTEGDANSSGIPARKYLFSNLKTDGLSKRNRKTFSPNSRLALIEAARSDNERIVLFKSNLVKSNLSDECSTTDLSQKMVIRQTCSQQGQNNVADDSSASTKDQDLLHCDGEQMQMVVFSESHHLSPPPTITDDGSPNVGIPLAPEPPVDSCTEVVPGSPEHKKEAYASRQSGENAVINLTRTEGSLHINMDCLPGSPTGHITPNENSNSSPHLKSILKTSSVDSDMEGVTCRGICKCPRCVSTCDLSETARGFITSQMKLAEGITRKLLAEMRNMRTLVEDEQNARVEGEASASCEISSEKANGALESAAKTEDWAIKQILKLSRDSKRVCRLIETGPRRTIFADDAGRQLCHVKHFPAKKTPMNL